MYPWRIKVKSIDTQAYCVSGFEIVNNINIKFIFTPPEIKSVTQ